MIADSATLTWRSRYTDAFDCLNLWLWADEHQHSRYPVVRASRERDAVLKRRDYLAHLLGLDEEQEEPDDPRDDYKYRMERRLEREGWE